MNFVGEGTIQLGTQLEYKRSYKTVLSMKHLILKIMISYEINNKMQ